MNQQEILSRVSAEKIITVIDLPEVGDDGVLYLNYICTKYRGTLKMYEVYKAFCWDSSENEWEYLGVYDEYEELLLSKIKRLERAKVPLPYCSGCGAAFLDEGGTKDIDSPFFPAIDGYVLRSEIISRLHRSGCKKAAAICKAFPVIERLERCSNKGKWTEVDRDVMGMKTFQCSNCGGKAYGYSEPNFCSHCGADMRKEDEEDD